jgi:hypothetical protein
VIFVWSQLIAQKKVDLPGNEYLRTRMPSSRFRFGGDQWTRIQEERRYSTSLSTHANYGPSLFNLCFLRSGPRRNEVRVHPMATYAIEAFESLLGDDCQHPAFTEFGAVTVKYEELERWGKLWDMNRITKAERTHISSVLGGKEAPLKRQAGIRLLTTTIGRLGDKDEPALRKGMCEIDAVGHDSILREAVVTWRGIQARQLFRLALESMFFWATREVGDGTRTLAQLTSAFLDFTPKAATASVWLLPRLDPDTVDVVGPLVQLEEALGGRITNSKLPAPIHAALRAALACRRTDSGEREDRLPLVRAEREARSFAKRTPAELLQFVLSAWVFGQHVSWSVGRGIADARQGTDRILRLKIVPDDSGWRLVPGSSTSAPRPTPDRLNTAVTLLRESAGRQ